MEGNNIIIDEETKKLLNTPLPDPPCHPAYKTDSCRDCKGFKSGCVDLLNYKSIWDKYNSHNILDYAIQLRLIRRTNKEINNMLIAVRDLIAQLPKEVTEVLGDEIYGWPKNLFKEDINNA